MIAATCAGALGGALARPSADSPAWSTARFEFVSPSALSRSCWTSVSDGAPPVGAAPTGARAFAGRGASRSRGGSLAGTVKTCDSACGSGALRAGVEWSSPPHPAVSRAQAQPAMRLPLRTAELYERGLVAVAVEAPAAAVDLKPDAGALVDLDAPAGGELVDHAQPVAATAETRVRVEARAGIVDLDADEVGDEAGGDHDPLILLEPRVAQRVGDQLGDEQADGVLELFGDPCLGQRTTRLPCGPGIRREREQDIRRRLSERGHNYYFSPRRRGLNLPCIK